MKLLIILLWAVYALAKMHRELDRIDPGSDNIISVTQYNYEEVLEYVKSKNGTLLLHPYKDKCGECIKINKNLKEVAKKIKQDPDMRDKFFVATCNLGQNRPLGNYKFVDPFPKVYYYTYYENMRKRKYSRITTPTVVLTFLRNLKPEEPEEWTKDMKLISQMRQINEHHLILGLFPNGKDEIYHNQLIEVSNKYSYLPFYACFETENITKELNLEINETTVLIYRKPEIKPPDLPDYVVWNKSVSLMEFVEGNYHMPVDIYTHDSQSLYDLHADDVGMIYYSGANTFYHQKNESTASKLLHMLHDIKYRLGKASHEFVTEESKGRYSRFTLALVFKQEFWIWGRKLDLKMKMDFTDEFSPIVYSHDKKFYMHTWLANSTLDTVNEDQIYQFYYDYIQGNLHEYNRSEPIEESYTIGQTWRRRLDQSENSTQILTPNEQKYEIRKIVSRNFRAEVEESGVEVLLIMVTDD